MQGTQAAFWVVLLLAVALGGGQAIAGFPALLGIILPPGVVAAQASDVPHDSIVDVPIAETIAPSRYAPEVLYPIVTREFPDWLLARTTEPVTPSPEPVRDPKVAIVIDDLGADLAHTDRALALPSTVALSFLPYADATPWLSAEALRGGHEVLVHMPMETVGDHDPGPLALTTDLSPDEIRRRLDVALSRVPGAIGINNHMGSKFTADTLALIPVAEDLAARHLLFFDSRTTPSTQVVSVSHSFGVASAGRDVFLDDEQTADAVGAQLIELEVRARAQGIAIAIGHPHDVTLAALAVWTAHAAAHGFTLVPLSEAIRLKTEREVRYSLAAH